MKEITQLTKVLLLMIAMALISLLLLACRSTHLSTKSTASNIVAEHQERVSTGQKIFDLFDSLTAVVNLSADSLQIEIFHLDFPIGQSDNLACTRPTRSDVSERLAARLSMKGIRSNTQLTHTHKASAESLFVDTASLQRSTHHEVTENAVVEKEVKPPNTFRNLAFLIMALALLLGVLLVAVGKFKR